MEDLLAWLTGLPPVALYAALLVTAAIENVFPPIPADTVVAFGSFLAARGEATPLMTFLMTWLGNVAGAMGVYAAGRRVPAGNVRQLLLRFGRERSEHRLEALYRKRGLAALFLSRFLPGVRALVPPFAGALRIPPLTTLVVIATASGIWYGAVTYAAYRIGADWENVQRVVARLARNLGLTAAIVAAAVVLFWAGLTLVRRARSRSGG